MIIVDVYVPSVGKEYNFSLNENVAVHTVIDEIAEMIGQKEQTFLSGDISGLMLFSREMQVVLPLDRTLTEAGITAGSSLILT